MVLVVVLPPLNDVVQFLGSFGQAITATHGLAKFPSVEALMTTEETTRFPRGSNKRRPAHGTKHVDDEFVEVGSIGRHSLDDALANILFIPSSVLSEVSSSSCSCFMIPTPSAKEGRHQR